MSTPVSLAVCFDATGTLIEATDSVGEVYHRVALEHGVDLPAWRLDDAFRRILPHAPRRGLDGDDPATRCDAERAWWRERIRETFQATDSTARFDDFEAFWTTLFDVYQRPDAWRVRPGITQVLETLAGRAVPMAVVSNFDHRLPKILEGAGIKGFFETIELPCLRGRAKPDRVLFERAAEALDRPLSSLVYVGDDPPERLERIAAHGLRVVDVGRLGHDLSGLVDLISRRS